MAKLLIISPTPFAPKNAGNRARIANLIDTFEALNHEVYFAHAEREAGCSRAMRQRLGDRFFSLPYKQPRTKLRPLRRIKRFLSLESAYLTPIDAWYDPSIGPCVNQLIIDCSIDIVIVEYAYFSKILESIPDRVFKIVDTHDVFANRHKHYQSLGITPEWLSCTEKDEIRALNRADLVFAIQEEEGKYFAARVNADVVVLGHSIRTEDKTVFPSKAAIGYIGSRNPINVRSIQWFVDEVLPLVRTQCEVEFVIGGDVVSEIKTRQVTRAIGKIDNLRDFYNQISIAINPALFGTGLKIKSVEPLGYGKPLVGTSVALQGVVGYTPMEIAEANDARSFSATLLDWLSDPSKLVERGVAAHRYCDDYNARLLTAAAEVVDFADRRKTGT